MSDSTAKAGPLSLNVLSTSAPAPVKEPEEGPCCSHCAGRGP